MAGRFEESRGGPEDLPHLTNCVAEVPHWLDLKALEQLLRCLSEAIVYNKMSAAAVVLKGPGWCEAIHRQLQISYFSYPTGNNFSSFLSLQIISTHWSRSPMKEGGSAGRERFRGWGPSYVEGWHWKGQRKRYSVTVKREETTAEGGPFPTQPASVYVESSLERCSGHHDCY